MWTDIVNQGKQMSGVTSFRELTQSLSPGYYALMNQAIETASSHLALPSPMLPEAIDIRKPPSDDEWLSCYASYQLELIRMCHQSTASQFERLIECCSPQIQFSTINCQVGSYLASTATQIGVPDSVWLGCFNDGVEYMKSIGLLENKYGLQTAEKAANNLHGGKDKCSLLKKSLRSVKTVLVLLNKPEQLNSLVEIYG